MTSEDLLLGSSLRLSTGGEHGAPSWGAWGSFSTGGFQADVDGVTLEGDVTTGLLGADVSGDAWLAGLAVSSSRGDGPFALTSAVASSRAKGTVESTLTAVYPYARLAISDQMDVWGVVGTGTGDLTITEAGGSPLSTDIGMTMGAIGTRAKLLEGTADFAFNLALKSDALWIRMNSEAVGDDNGTLAAAAADVTRMRLTLEGSRNFEVGGGRTFTPSAEVGLRHDGGDAETGIGLELGAGVKFAGHGFSIEGAVRALSRARGLGLRGMGRVRKRADRSGRHGPRSLVHYRADMGRSVERRRPALGARPPAGCRPGPRIRARSKARHPAPLRAWRAGYPRHRDPLRGPLACRRGQPHYRAGAR